MCSMTAVVITAVNKKKRSVELMKMKKRIMGILLSIALVMGLIPSMSLTAYAEENHQIHNTISDIISLSITRNGTPVTEANSGDTITLTVNGSLTTGSNSTFSRFDRNIMIDGLAVSDTGGNEVSLQSAGSLSWTFTMPNSDVYITFPLLTAGSSIPVGAGQAVFRSGKSNGNGYSFIANKQDGSSYDDTVGYLAYIQGGGNYKFVVDDDSGSNGNSHYNFRIPSSGQVSIDNGTYFHIGFALYSNDNSGTFSPSGNTGDITISFIAVQKTRQIISANNLTISVNDMDKKVNASITNGDGTLSYTVLEGTDVITVNRNTGAITPLKTGTARIEIEASETDTFQRTTSTITVTVEKARAVAATVAANNRTYDGTEKPLVTISGEPTGGTMYYALGEDTTTAPDDNLFTTSIPAKTDVGTYYVWYMVKGDSDHTDSAPAPVIVTIAEKQTEAPADPATPEETEAPAVPDNPKDEAAPAKIQANASIQLNAGFLVYWKGSTVCVKWGKAPEADQFEIYAQYCGSKTCKKIMTVKSGNSASFKRLNGKKLNRKLVVKVYVVASKNGKEIGRTLLGHAAGSKNSHTNAKNVKVSKKSYTLAVGKSAKIKAKIVKAKSGKKLLGKGHCAKVRYTSSNTKVATVSKSGKIKAVGKGKCDIRIFAQNGRSCKVTVTVK